MKEVAAENTVRQCPGLAKMVARRAGINNRHTVWSTRRNTRATSMKAVSVQTEKQTDHFRTHKIFAVFHIFCGSFGDVLEMVLDLKKLCFQIILLNK